MNATPYPVNLDLRGRRALVVGGGSVAARKVAGLLASGAQVTVVAPKAVDEIADDPAHCAFTLPAVSRRDDLQVAVSTNGRSPAVAAWLRRTIDSAIGPEHGAVLALATEVRAELRESTGTSESPAWVDALDDDLLDLVRAGDRDGARARLRTALGLDGPLVDGASR